MEHIFKNLGFIKTHFDFQNIHYKVVVYKTHIDVGTGF